MIIPFAGTSPIIAPDVFIAPDALISGAVEIATGASVFFGAVLRGDLMPIRIGECSNIQDHVVIHTSHQRVATEIGSGVSVGHRAILHGCRIDSDSLIGMGAILLDQAHVESHCLIGAGSLLTEGMHIPAGSLAVGSPARVIRRLSEEEQESIRETARRYSRISHEYLQMLSKPDSGKE